MGRSVALVTDSTAYLGADDLRDRAITVVPLQVVIDGRAFDEGEGLAPGDVAEALRHSRNVSTSRIAPEALQATYASVAASGADEIVSVHLSAELSGTYESAVLAAREASVPVHVVDSRSLGMGMGFAVLSASDALVSGASAADAVVVARERAAASAAVFYVDTLDHLRRGGRISATTALLGTALHVKPLLHLVDGRIAPLENVRTASRALARLEEVALDRAGLEMVEVAVHHLAAEERAQTLADSLRGRLPASIRVVVREVGPVIGAHVGPGMVAVVVAPVPGAAGRR